MKHLRISFITIALTLACCWVISAYNETPDVKCQRTPTPSLDSLEYRHDYQRCVENIMLTEGFCRYPYKCAAGFPTIGFGHLIQKGDRFTYPMTFHRAYQLLLSDFNGSIAYARELGYENDDSKQLAVAHAIFCLGIGTVSKLVQSGFKDNVLKYCRYKSPDGVWHTSNYIRKSRQFELNLYNK